MGAAPGGCDDDAIKLTQLMKPLGRCSLEEVKVMDLKSADLLVDCCNVCTHGMNGYSELQQKQHFQHFEEVCMMTPD